MPQDPLPELWGSCSGEITVAADLTAPTDIEPDWIGESEAERNELPPEPAGPAGSASVPTSRDNTIDGAAARHRTRWA